MRWSLFFLWAYLLIGLQSALAEAIAIESDWGLIEPRFVLTLAVFIGLSASPSIVLAAWGLLGFGLDASSTWVLPDGNGVTLIGPYTLGYLAGAYTILELRSMLFRYHPLTIASMIIAGGAAVMLIVTLLFSIRGWYEAWEQWSATDELITRSLGLAYSAAIGVVLSWPMVKMAPLFAFTGQQGRGRRFGR